MYWKERYGGRVSRATRVAAVLVVLGVVSGVGYCLYELAEPAFSELLAEGYGAAGTFNDAGVLAATARIVGAFLYSLMALGVGVAAASSVAGEREQDTWFSLLTTDLTGAEILRAKLFGAVWSGRWIFASAALLWLVATAGGGMHVFGLLMELVSTAVFIWFAAALGLYYSLTRRNSTRALCWTIGMLVFLNGGYLMILAWFFHESGWIIAGSTPYIVGLVGVSVEEVWVISGFLDHTWYSLLTGPEGPGLVAGCLISLVGYGTVAAGLTAYCVRSFDRIVDRPSAVDRSVRAAEPRPSAARAGGARSGRPRRRRARGPVGRSGRRSRSGRPRSREDPLGGEVAAADGALHRGGPAGVGPVAGQEEAVDRRPLRRAERLDPRPDREGRPVLGDDPPAHELRLACRRPDRRQVVEDRRRGSPSLSSGSRSYEALMTSWRYWPPPHRFAALDRRVVEDPLDQPADRDGVVDAGRPAGRTRGGRR